MIKKAIRISCQGGETITILETPLQCIGRCRWWSYQCTMCCLYSIFSSQSNEVGHDLTPYNCDIIQHIFSPTRSIARKTLLWTFLWASNSKFVIFPELYPCINYRILAFYAPIPVQIHGNSIIPPYHIQGNFEYGGILLYKQHIVHWALDVLPSPNDFKASSFVKLFAPA